MFHRILDTMWGQASNLLTAPIRRRRWTDLLVIAALVGLVLGLMLVARQWTGEQRPLVEIDLSLRSLPKYALLSLVRAGVAYCISMAFTLVFAYWAARDPWAERFLIPILDILQSVPLLAFMPVVLLAMMNIFQHSNVGIEMSAVVLIVTCQAWNMAFSFYQSLKTIPSALDEAARGYGLNWLQRLRWVELPFATPGLVWNSMVSVANGWFFLMASEAFKLGSQDFRLPGLGAYMSVAVDRGDFRAQVYAILTMLFIVILLDQLLWKPVVAWSQRFQMDDSAQVARQKSWLLRLLRRSVLISRFRHAVWHWLSRYRPRPQVQPLVRKGDTNFQRGIVFGMLLLVLLALALASFKLFEVLAQVRPAQWIYLAKAGAASLGRVLSSTILATCWTLPIGLWIGLSPRWSRRLQPLVQVVASFPMSILFFALILWLKRHGVGLFSSSMLLMSLSTQWYLLFNIIAGAQAVPTGLREVGHAYRLSLWKSARHLYFPAIFPYLVTGWVTATGGAWNASIITEYVQAQGQTLSTVGLGASVAMAADQRDIPMLAASALLMAFLVVIFNRLVWGRLYRLAETRYALNR
jgi:NitT/TauT family transport system permease protein